MYYLLCLSVHRLQFKSNLIPHLTLQIAKHTKSLHIHYLVCDVRFFLCFVDNCSNSFTFLTLPTSPFTKYLVNKETF